MTDPAAPDTSAATGPDPHLDHERLEAEQAYARKQFELLLYRLQQLPVESRARVQGRCMQALLDLTFEVATPHGPLTFVAFGRLATARGFSVLTKQPATIAWIDGFRPDGVFWDIGANIGAFSLYAARRGVRQVVAFEPAAVNYFVLSANCEASGLDDRITCLLAGLGAERSVRKLEVSQFAPAESFSFRGKRDRPRVGRQAAMIVSMDELVEQHALPCPTYVKVDVPGLSEEIIKGGLRTLARPEVREFHIELREESTGGQRILGMLRQCGFAPSAQTRHGGSSDWTFVKE